MKTIKSVAKQVLSWTSKDGTVISIDDMDEQHVRNALKMIARSYHNGIIDIQKPYHNECDATKSDIY